MKIELTDDEVSCIVQVLRRNADADEEAAESLRIEGASKRLAFTFEEQARKQRALADKLENAE